MVTRQAMRALRRTPGKTLLFFALLAALSLLLGLGINIWAQAESLLAACGERYTTLAVVEYMGADYPDESVYDASMQEALAGFDDAVISDSPHVLRWDRQHRMLGSIEGYSWQNPARPYPNEAVIALNSFSAMAEPNTYMAHIVRNLYNAEGYDDIFVLVTDLDFVPEYGHTYLMHGQFFFGRANYKYFRSAAFESAAAETAGVDTAAVAPVVDVTEDLDGFLAANPVYGQIADTYRTMNNSVSVYATGALELLPQFHQGEYYVTGGRAFTPEEYASSARVCVVNEAIADVMGVGVGDTLRLSLTKTGDFPVYQSYWAGSGFAAVEDFEIVGITNLVAGANQCVYIPESSAWPLGAQIGYSVGQAELRDGETAEFLAEIDPFLADRMQVTVYDQGYTAVAESLDGIRRVATAVTVICASAGVAVLLLFGLLFVYRQRETFGIMLALGAGKHRARGYLLTSAGALSLFAGAAGALAGYFTAGGIAGSLTKTVADSQNVALYYSAGNLGISLPFDLSIKADPLVFAATALALLAAALVSGLIFLRRVELADEGQRRRKAVAAAAAEDEPLPVASSRPPAEPEKPKSRAAHTAPPVPSRLRARLTFGSSLRFAVRSILRSGVRAFATPLAAVVLTLLVFALTSASDSYRRQLDDTVAETRIDGCFTSLDGKQIHSLGLSAMHPRAMTESGLFRHFSLSFGVHQLYQGVAFDADGVDQHCQPVFVPRTQYGYETLMNMVGRAPYLIWTNDLAKTSEFFYADTLSVDFAPGYSLDVFAEPVDPDGPLVCIVPADWMEEKGIEYGETIRLNVSYDLYEVDSLVVGSFGRQGSQQNIYTPLASAFDPAWLAAPLDGTTQFHPDALPYSYSRYDVPPVYTVDQQLRTFDFSTAAFTVEASRLEDAKLWLRDYGVSEVSRLGSVRHTVLLDDKTFLDTCSQLERHISFMALLTPILYALVAGIGFVLSYLLVAGRRRECLIMRSLGGQRRRVFLSFFLEQFLLALLGCAAALALWVCFAPLGAPQFLGLALVLPCYLLGAALSVLLLARVHLLAALDEG